MTKPFVFTPHLRSEENPTDLSNDLLGDVKLFLASIAFGEHYSKISRLGDVEGRRIREKPYAQLPQETEESRNYFLKRLREEF